MITSSVASRVFGRFASKKFPKFFQNIINKVYVITMRVNLGEFYDSSRYESLNELFTRSFVQMRAFDENKNSFIFPCDSYIMECGITKKHTALQIKGFSYNIYDLLSSKIDTRSRKRVDNGNYVNFYLSPKDYHRYHAPIDMKVQKAVHIPGKLFSVNARWLKKIPNLFIENERVVLECKTVDDKIFYMVFVGALNVGKISFIFDERIQTNLSLQSPTVYKYKDLFFKKGIELGRFEMGSTVLMFFEKDLITTRYGLGINVRFGDVMAKIKNTKLD